MTVVAAILHGIRKMVQELGRLVQRVGTLAKAVRKFWLTLRPAKAPTPKPAKAPKPQSRKAPKSKPRKASNRNPRRRSPGKVKSQRAAKGNPQTPVTRSSGPARQIQIEQLICEGKMPSLDQVVAAMMRHGENTGPRILAAWQKSLRP